MTNILTVKNLSVGFGEGDHIQLAINQLSFSLGKGQCMGLVGESGSGKSMTALAIMQLLPHTAWINQHSQVLFHGKDLLTLSERRMRRVRGLKIAMIFQDAMSAFNPVLTIGQQMEEVLRKCDRDCYQRALQLLDEVGINNPDRTYHSYAHQLSGGMRQRAMIAMALCGDPDIMIADEPTTALDVTIQAQVLNLLQSLQKKHDMSLLFISHDLAVVSQLADDITVLKRGKVIEQATSEQFFTAPSQDYSRQLLAAIPSNEARYEAKTKDQPLLQLEKIKVYFPIRKGILRRKVGDIKAVDGIDLQVMPGQTLALVGESGSGKTTTGKAIVKLNKVTQGSINFVGAKKDFRRDVQMIFQDPYAALNPRMTIADSIMEGMRTQHTVRGRKNRLTRVKELLQQVGLSSEQLWRYPHEFSGGERQRICIARALALRPKLLILDEPTSALDVSTQMQVLRLLEHLQQEHGLAYLLITHNLSVVAYLSHTMAVMQQGRIVEQGETTLLLQHPQHTYTKQLLAAVPQIKE